MDLLADVCIPCCLGMGHCVGYVAGKSLEVKLHRGLDCRGEMARMLDCMFEGVALGIYSGARAERLIWNQLSYWHL